ncbi:hypothetical protein GJ496_009011, partial [Pomphorhynchus laevis]
KLNHHASPPSASSQQLLQSSTLSQSFRSSPATAAKHFYSNAPNSNNNSNSDHINHQNSLTSLLKSEPTEILSPAQALQAVLQEQSIAAVAQSPSPHNIYHALPILDICDLPSPRINGKPQAEFANSTSSSASASSSLSSSSSEYLHPSTEFDLNNSLSPNCGSSQNDNFRQIATVLPPGSHLVNSPNHFLHQQQQHLNFNPQHHQQQQLGQASSGIIYPNHVPGQLTSAASSTGDQKELLLFQNLHHQQNAGSPQQYYIHLYQNNPKQQNFAPSNLSINNTTSPFIQSSCHMNNIQQQMNSRLGSAQACSVSTAAIDGSNGIRQIQQNSTTVAAGQLQQLHNNSAIAASHQGSSIPGVQTGSSALNRSSSFCLQQQQQPLQHQQLSQSRLIEEQLMSAIAAGNVIGGNISPFNSNNNVVSANNSDINNANNTRIQLLSGRNRFSSGSNNSDGCSSNSNSLSTNNNCSNANYDVTITGEHQQHQSITRNASLTPTSMTACESNNIPNSIGNHNASLLLNTAATIPAQPNNRNISNSAVTLYNRQLNNTSNSSNNNSIGATGVAVNVNGGGTNSNNATNNPIIGQPTSSGLTMEQVHETVTKFRNFLATLLRLAHKDDVVAAGAGSPLTKVNTLHQLICSLLEGSIGPDTFTQNLQQHFSSPTQPQLTPFLQRALPLVRQFYSTSSFMTLVIKHAKELIIRGSASLLPVMQSYHHQQQQGISNSVNNAGNVNTAAQLTNQQRQLLTRNLRQIMSNPHTESSNIGLNIPSSSASSSKAAMTTMASTTSAMRQQQAVNLLGMRPSSSSLSLPSAAAAVAAAASRSPQVCLPLEIKTNAGTLWLRPSTSSSSSTPTAGVANKPQCNQSSPSPAAENTIASGLSYNIHSCPTITTIASNNSLSSLASSNVSGGSNSSSNTTANHQMIINKQQMSRSTLSLINQHVAVRDEGGSTTTAATCQVSGGSGGQPSNISPGKLFNNSAEPSSSLSSLTMPQSGQRNINLDSMLDEIPLSSSSAGGFNDCLKEQMPRHSLISQLPHLLNNDNVNIPRNICSSSSTLLTALRSSSTPPLTAEAANVAAVTSAGRQGLVRSHLAQTVINNSCISNSNSNRTATALSLSPSTLSSSTLLSSPTSNANVPPSSSESAINVPGDSTLFTSSTGGTMSSQADPDDEINDVTAMAGVNLLEEIKSCYQSNAGSDTSSHSNPRVLEEFSEPGFFNVEELQKLFNGIAEEYGLAAPGADFTRFISDLAEDFLSKVIEKAFGYAILRNAVIDQV